MSIPHLFLDFDGVTHPAQGSAVPDFAFAPLLDAVLAPYQCQIVIASTWREHYPIERLVGFLPAGLASRVVGVLGPDCRGPHVRHRNILAWLQEHPEVGTQDWRALDDAAHEFPAGCPNLVLCDGMRGFGERAT